MTPAFEVAVEDTTAAGDAFCGALVAALASGEALPEALVWGCAGGALACTKLGAEPSLPLRGELERLVASRLTLR
jgi:ribokinase